MMQKHGDKGGKSCKNMEIQEGSHAKTGRYRRKIMQKKGDTGG